MPSRRLALLLPSYEGSTSAVANLDPPRSLDRLLPSGWTCETIFLTKSTVNKTIRRRKKDFDVFVNLCDGAWDEDTPGVDVVLAMEKEKLAFTGASSLFYDPTREGMKKACFACSVPTPRYAFAETVADCDTIAKRLNFPLFVKHHHSYNSIGVTTKSKVANLEQLREQVAGMVAEFGGALVEEFIPGREFSVLVSSNPADEREPFVYLPVECTFQEGQPDFKTFEMKWVHSSNHWVAASDAKAVETMKKYAKEIYVCLAGQGYGRCDFRMAPDGKIYFLEINPNCSVFYDPSNGGTADLILELDGTGQAAFLRSIVDFALARQQREYFGEPMAFAPHADPALGGGSFATRDIAPGEIVQRNEEKQLILASHSHMKRNWPKHYYEMYEHYAWKVSEGVFALCSSLDPERWQPINHSCDPSCWMEGLNLVARRPLRRGEEVTMDYSTMYTSFPVDFKCACGAAACRGRLTGEEYKQAWFIERYGDEHVTDYVRSRMREAAVLDGVC
eukprot:tig00001187_g7459.t1